MDALPYPLLHGLHVGFVTVSGLLFLLRSRWLLTGSPQLRSFWARRLPHLNDTLLLVAGVLLALRLGFAPWRDPWLAVKLSAVVVHIVLALVAFRGPRGLRPIAWGGSAAAFGFAVAVALTKDPVPF